GTMREQDIRTKADMSKCWTRSERHPIDEERQARNQQEAFKFLTEHNVRKVTVKFAGVMCNYGDRDDPDWKFEYRRSLWSLSAVDAQGEHIELDDKLHCVDDIITDIQADLGGTDDESDSAKGTIVLDVPARKITLDVETKRWVTECKVEQVNETWTV